MIYSPDSIVQVVKSTLKHALSPIISVLAILALLLVPLAIWSQSIVVTYVILGLITFICLLFSGVYIYFALKHPEKLHSESHIAEMTAMKLGSDNPKPIEYQARQALLENIKESVEAGTLTSYQIEDKTVNKD